MRQLIFIFSFVLFVSSLSCAAATQEVDTTIVKYNRQPTFEAAEPGMFFLACVGTLFNAHSQGVQYCREFTIDLYRLDDIERQGLKNTYKEVKIITNSKILRREAKK